VWYAQRVGDVCSGATNESPVATVLTGLGHTTSAMLAASINASASVLDANTDLMSVRDTTGISVWPVGWLCDA
jgi:hypothetical protein